MNVIWQRFTLSNLPLKDYLRTSYLHRSFVGLLRPWRQTSILMQWGDIIAVAFLSLVYALAPFVANELLALLMVACVGFWLLLTLSDEAARENAFGFTPIHLSILLFWGVSAIAAAASPVKKIALMGLLKDFGTLTLYLLLFALCAKVLRSPRFRSWLIILYLHVSLIVSVYGLRQWYFGAPPLATWVDPTSTLSKTTRVYSYLGNPNLLAGYLIPAVVFSLMAIFVWQSWFKKALAGTMFVVNCSCLILTLSRGGWIGLVVALLTLLGLLYYWWSVDMSRFWRTWSVWIVLGTLTVFLLVSMVFVEPVRERISSIFIGRNDSSNNFRQNVWTAVFKMIADYPLLGIGPGHSAFNKIYPLYQLPRFNALSAYSIFLEVTVETGLLGLASFLWLLIVIFNTGISQLRRLRASRNVEAFWLMGAIASLVGTLGDNLFDTVWYRPEINTLWWLMVGIVASYYTPSPQNQKNAS